MFFDGTDSKYIETATATMYSQQNDGAHKWYTAPSGTAGNAISFTQAMTLDASRNLSAGTTRIASSIQTNGITAGSVLATVGGLAAHTTNAGILEYQPATNAVSLRAYGNTAGSGYIVFKTGGGGDSEDTESARIDSSGNLIQTVNTTAATLSTNGTLTFSIVDNSTLRISVRGSDGTTRTATVALT
jgi:hypothetical protein